LFYELTVQKGFGLVNALIVWNNVSLNIVLLIINCFQTVGTVEAELNLSWGTVLKKYYMWRSYIPLHIK